MQVVWKLLNQIFEHIWQVSCGLTVMPYFVEFQGYL